VIISDHSSDHNINNCKYCKKLFANRHSRWRHEKTCKNNTQNNILEENNNLKELTNTFKKEILDLKTQITEILNTQAKIHPKTLQKINKQLINNTNGNNNTINNGTVINNTYVKFGSISHSKLLSEKTILNILSKPYQCIEESIKNIHFNKNLPEYNNIYITNMKDDIVYIFDGKKFISVKKNEVIEDLIDNHKEQIKDSFEEYKSKLREFIAKRLQSFLYLINNEDESIKEKIEDFFFY